MEEFAMKKLEEHSNKLKPTEFQKSIARLLEQRAELMMDLLATIKYKYPELLDDVLSSIIFSFVLTFKDTTDEAIAVIKKSIEDVKYIDSIITKGE